MRARDFLGDLPHRGLMMRMAIDPDWIGIDGEQDGLTLIAIRRTDWLPPGLKPDHPRYSNDCAGILAMHTFVKEGPKILLATPEQCDAMAQVEVNLHPTEYAQPYPVVAVAFPDQRFFPFKGVILHHTRLALVGVIYPYAGREADEMITTLDTRGDRTVEARIREFEESVGDAAIPGHLALRVACNLCLAMGNFGVQAELFYPKEAASDRRLAAEPGERGRRARERLATAPTRLSFHQDVKLYHEEGRSGAPGEGGHEVRPHWRRGHWAMQPHGEGARLRKRIFRRPVMVRQDLFTGRAADTSTTYRG